MDKTLADLLLAQVMNEPGVVDDLWQCKNGTPTDRHGVEACLRIDKQLGGQGVPASEIAVELSHNAGLYIDFLLDPARYPEQFRKKAEAMFPPLGHMPRWSTPPGFKNDAGMQKWPNRMTSNSRDTRLRLGGASAALIIVEEPSETRLRFPWQQALFAHRHLTIWDPPEMRPRFPRISSHYIRIATTQAYEVCYSDHRLQYAKVPLLIEPGLECMIEFQSLSLEIEKPYFEAFLQSIT